MTNNILTNYYLRVSDNIDEVRAFCDTATVEPVTLTYTNGATKEALCIEYSNDTFNDRFIVENGDVIIKINNQLFRYTDSMSDKVLVTLEKFLRNTGRWQ